MAAKFVLVDHDTPLLLPPDLRDWIPKGHMVHFVMDAVDAFDLKAAKVNERGTGSAQYPPATMLALLIYCYATGTFSSHKIGDLTYNSVPVRFLTADTHPDHDSICKFRRENKELLSSCFHQILELAATANILKVGDLTVSVGGTKILANASKHSAMSYHRVEKQTKLAQDQIAELLAKAEEADAVPLQDGLTIPAEIQLREDRLIKLREAKKVMEERAAERLLKEQAEHQAKLVERQLKLNPNDSCGTHSPVVNLSQHNRREGPYRLCWERMMTSRFGRGTIHFLIVVELNYSCRQTKLAAIGVEKSQHLVPQITAKRATASFQGTSR